MSDALSKELHLAAGKVNFSRLLKALHKVEAQDPSSAMPLIHDAAHVFSYFLRSHSGLMEEDVRTATSMFTLAMVNAKTDYSAEPLFKQSNDD